ncbi:hypothetical protein NEF87_000134 [Candidatus Lokiarchaeum ossiferum]|uniref:RCK N-terminal domain-containing protein n=1 Tax=Candidatus Lokiarchaeum ossiferum TaxID=2951803 RepID=A0ABY6HMP5_9ARCH|nr:hypothetical protein NEF87_000134 [Candidatus Lokiarchaeum sp. B-35]
MSLNTFLIDLKLKIKQNKWPIMVCIGFWLMGFIFFYLVENDKAIGNILLISFGIRNSNNHSDMAGLYNLVWPVLLETIILGFIFGALFKKYNPVITSQILAKHQRNHTIVIGSTHLGERIIEYLQLNNKNFVLIEREDNKVENLINSSAPVVIGDATDDEILIDASISKAKEVFITINDARDSIVICNKIRDINKDCALYVRLFGDYYYKYLAQEPINAFSFSTSKWAMSSIKEWSQGETGKTLVLGRDNLSQRIAEYLGKDQSRPTVIMDEHIDSDLYDEESAINAISDSANRLRFIEDHINLNEVTQIFIVWKEEEEFSDSLYLCTRLNQKYPSIKVYVRIFDEELAAIMERFNATTFSTSAYAFNMLQKQVQKDSAIYKKKVILTKE